MRHVVFVYSGLEEITARNIVNIIIARDPSAINFIGLATTREQALKMVRSQPDCLVISGSHHHFPDDVNRQPASAFVDVVRQIANGAVVVLVACSNPHENIQHFGNADAIIDWRIGVLKVTHIIMAAAREGMTAEQVITLPNVQPVHVK